MVSENKNQGEADTFIFKAGDYFSITMSNFIFINLLEENNLWQEMKSKQIKLTRAQCCGAPLVSDLGVKCS